jgi:hypothetical protein
MKNNQTSMTLWPARHIGIGMGASGLIGIFDFKEWHKGRHVLYVRYRDAMRDTSIHRFSFSG